MKFSIDRVTNKSILKQAAANSPSPLIGNLKSVKTNGKYAVTFNLKAPQVTWPAILATQCCAIVPSDSYAPDKLMPNTSQQIGTGPYKLVKYTAGQQAVFQAYSGYWGTKPKTSNLIINYYSKSSTMKLALQKGEIDMAYQSFTPTEITSLQHQKGLRVYSGAGGRIRYLTMNVTREPAKNVAVRRAIAYLMPRQAIATRVYHGQVTPLYSMVPAGYPGHIDAFATAYGRTPNPAKAKQVLQAGRPDDALPGRDLVDADALRRRLGGRVRRDQAWPREERHLQGDVEVVRVGAVQRHARDAVQRLPARLVPGLPGRRGLPRALLPLRHVHPERLQEPEDGSADQERAGSCQALSQRLGFIRQIQILAAKDAPIIPYWQQAMIAVGRNDVHGIPSTLDPTVYMRFNKLSKS